MAQNFFRTDEFEVLSLRQPFILYCVIAVLLNGVIALGWILYREVRLSTDPGKEAVQK
jgi:hypothetical protein